MLRDPGTAHVHPFSDLCHRAGAATMALEYGTCGWDLPTCPGLDVHAMLRIIEDRQRASTNSLSAEIGEANLRRAGALLSAVLNAVVGADTTDTDRAKR